MSDIVEIYAGNFMDAELLKTILQDSEIEVFMQNENMGTIAPWQIAAGGAGAVKVIVRTEDYEKAKPIVDEFIKNSK